MNLEITKEQCRLVAACIRSRAVETIQENLVRLQPDEALNLEPLEKALELLRISDYMAQSAGLANGGTGSSRKRRAEAERPAESPKGPERPENSGKSENRAEEDKATKRRVLEELLELRKKHGAGAYGQLSERSGVPTEIIQAMAVGQKVDIRRWRAVDRALAEATAACGEEKQDGEP